MSVTVVINAQVLVPSGWADRHLHGHPLVLDASSRWCGPGNAPASTSTTLWHMRIAQMGAVGSAPAGELDLADDEPPLSVEEFDAIWQQAKDLGGARL